MIEFGTYSFIFRIKESKALMKGGEECNVDETFVNVFQRTKFSS